MANNLWLAGGTGNYGTGTNWSLGAAPVSTNDAFIEEGTEEIATGLNQSAVLLNSFSRSQGFTGKIGDGSAYLQLGFGAGKVANLGYHFGGTTTPLGPGREMIDFGNNDVTVNVYGTQSTASESSKQPTRLLFANAGAILNVFKGQVGVACNVAGEVSELATINQAYLENQSADSHLVLGRGVTVATINKTGGDLETESLPTTLKHSGGSALLQKSSGTLATLNQDGGTVDTVGAFAITAINAKGGTLNSNSTGTIGALNISGGAVVDFLKNNAARTITAVNVVGAFTFRGDSAVLALTNNINLATATKPMEIVATAA